MTIGTHSEQITFSVTDLGKSDVFLGHEWLHFHNLSVDWQLGELKFNYCPKACQLSLLLSEPEEEDKPGEVETFPTGEVEDGDRIFAFDMFGYWVTGGHHLRAHTTTAQQLTEKALKPSGTKSFEETIPPNYHQFHDIFNKESFDQLPKRCPWDHAIDLTPGDHVVDCKVYNLSPEEQRELQAFMEENLHSGCIRPSKSPFASAFFFVKKKDGKLRPVQDYWKLNAFTVKNQYLLPLIPKLVNKLKGAKYFTKLNVRWGYNNVRIRESDKWKVAFRTNLRLFELTVMFFGLTNSPSTFHNLMNDIFHDLIAKGKVLVYLDDILIFTKTLEEHHQITSHVLQVL